MLQKLTFAVLVFHKAVEKHNDIPSSKANKSPTSTGRAADIVTLWASGAAVAGFCGGLEGRSRGKVLKLG
jgi:hypothetical protein